MQNDHGGAGVSLPSSLLPLLRARSADMSIQSDPAADMHFHDGFDLGDTDMTDFDHADFLPDLDLASFPPPSAGNIGTTGNDPTNPHDFDQQYDQHGAQLPADHAAADSVMRENADDDDDDDDDDDQMTGVGAGPLPTGFGVSLPANAGSTLTDFTKRRNWSQRVVEEIKDFLHILTPDGRVIYVSPSVSILTGYESPDFVGKIMANFIHPDDSGMFMREFHESIASGNAVRFFYRLRKADQTYSIFEVQGHPHFSSDVTAGYGGGGGSHAVSFCRGFFMMSRPYPSKNASLLDSFLEHKIENERLKKRIADLRREEQEDLQEQYMTASGPSSITGDRGALSGSMTPSAAKARQPSFAGDGASRVVSTNDSDYNTMPPPAKPPSSNWALTQRNLDEALADARPDSINDKMARYEGSNHLEAIELMTGLRYREGERSKGISTGAMSPTLVRGDQGIEYPVDAGGRRLSSEKTHPLPDSPSRAFGGSDSERKKKLKVADEYVCTDCGTLDSPEWRRGPNGPKTLCNACGLRWAKQEKKRTGTAPGNGNGKPSGGANGTKGPDPNRRRSSVGNGSTSSPTTAQPPPLEAGSTHPSPNPGVAAIGTGGLGGGIGNMPIFTGNPSGAPAVSPRSAMSINIPAAQAVQNMQGMTGSPMSGTSPMAGPGGLGGPVGAAGNLMGGGPSAPGMPAIVGGGGGGGGSGGGSSMGYTGAGHRGSMSMMPGQGGGGGGGQPS